MMRRIYGDRIAGAKARAVRLGMWPLPVVPVGYVKGEDRKLRPGPDAVKVVRAFELRAGSVPWSAVGELLERGASGASRVVTNRVYLGEINYGEFSNPTAHEPLVSRELFESAQLGHPAPIRLGGREYLLAGILRCAACRGLLTGTSQPPPKTWVGYRCMGKRSEGKCAAPATISARKVEPYLEHLVRERLGGHTIAERSADLAEARDELAEAEAERDEFVRAVEAAGVGAQHVAEGLRVRVERVEERPEGLARSTRGRRSRVTR